jgi:hypothetical protein
MCYKIHHSILPIEYELVVYSAVEPATTPLLVNTVGLNLHQQWKDLLLTANINNLGNDYEMLRTGRRQNLPALFAILFTL